jgi:hypothetical protein
MKKISTFRGQKGENRLPEPKNGIWGPKSVWSCDISIVREFYMEKEKLYFGDQKDRKSLQSLKTEFWAQNQYGDVIYPSFGNFTWSKKKYTLEG